MKIFPLREGSYTVDQSKQFLPFDPRTEQLSERPRGSLLVEICPFLVQAGEDLILLDTGLGFQDESGGMLLHRRIREQGYDPHQVTRVLMSHLHKDHAGGLALRRNGQTFAEPAFPGATYYVQELEWKAALEPGSSSYVREDILPLEHHRGIELLEGEGQIGPHIRYALSGGHSPHHQVFWISEGGETVFFGGDEAPQLGQMKKKYIAKYDHDGRRAMELRQQWWEQGRAENWTFLFYHDIKHPVIRPV